MIKAFHNSISVLMALLVLFSTLSFTVDKHFCGSILVDKAIFSEAKTCGMEMESSSEKDSCCSHEQIAVEGQDELKHTFETFDLNQQVFLAGFVYSYIFIFEEASKEAIPFKNYSPPLLVTDIQVRDQVFLI